MRALAQAARYGARRSAPPDPPFEAVDADTAAAARVIAEGLGRGRGWLPPVTSSACCAAGASPWPTAVTRAAREIASELEAAGMAVDAFHLLNPVVAAPEGALVVDARVRLEAPGRTPAFPWLNA